MFKKNKVRIEVVDITDNHELIDKICKDFLPKELNDAMDKILEEKPKNDFKFYVANTGEIIEIEVFKKPVTPDKKYFIAHSPEFDTVQGISVEEYEEYVFDNEVEALMKANKILTSKTKKK